MVLRSAASNRRAARRAPDHPRRPSTRRRRPRLASHSTPPDLPLVLSQPARRMTPPPAGSGPVGLRCDLVGDRVACSRVMRATPRPGDQSWRQAATLRADEQRALPVVPRALAARLEPIAPAGPGTAGSTAPPATRPRSRNRPPQCPCALRSPRPRRRARRRAREPEAVVQQRHDRPVPRTHQLGRPQQRALLLRRQRARRWLRQRLALDVCRPQANEQVRSGPPPRAPGSPPPASTPDRPSDAA